MAEAEKKHLTPQARVARIVVSSFTGARVGTAIMPVFGTFVGGIVGTVAGRMIAGRLVDNTAPESAVVDETLEPLESDTQASTSA